MVAVVARNQRLPVHVAAARLAKTRAEPIQNLGVSQGANDENFMVSKMHPIPVSCKTTVVPFQGEQQQHFRLRHVEFRQQLHRPNVRFRQQQLRHYDKFHLWQGRLHFLNLKGPLI